MRSVTRRERTLVDGDRVGRALGQTEQAEGDEQSLLSRLHLPAGALASLAVLPLLLSACGAGPLSATAGRSQNAGLAYARCMRSDGVPNFPDPDAHGAFPPFRSGVSKQTSDAAEQACHHLLPSGEDTSQGGHEKLDFALRVADCMHSHGFPSYPEPAVSGQGYGVSFTGTGIDAKSPQFQTAQTECEKQAQEADPKVRDQ
jgi:hypothetical protein